MTDLLMKCIARIRSDFPTKFGVPRQSGLVDALEALVVFEPEFRNPDALRGLDGFSHIWLIWQFSPGRCGRPGPRRSVRPGWAVMRGWGSSPPALPSAPIPSGSPACGCLEWRSSPGWGLCCGWRAPIWWTARLFSISSLICPIPISGPRPPPALPPARTRFWRSSFRPACWSGCPRKSGRPLDGVLSCDPRPAYQKDPDRVYGLDFAGLNVRFSVCGQLLTVLDVRPLPAH